MPQAVFAEFIHMTAFVTIAIGVLSSSCHDADIGVSTSSSSAVGSVMPLSEQRWGLATDACFDLHSILWPGAEAYLWKAAQPLLPHYEATCR